MIGSCETVEVRVGDDEGDGARSRACKTTIVFAPVAIVNAETVSVFPTSTVHVAGTVGGRKALGERRNPLAIRQRLASDRFVDSRRSTDHTGWVL